LIGSLLKSLEQLPDRRFRAVIGKSLLYSLLVYAILVAASWYGLGYINVFGIGWVDGALHWLGGAVAFVIGFLLFPGIVAAVIGLFLEEIARAVEARHYPDLPPPRGTTLAMDIWSAVRLAGLALALNVLALPLYFVPVLNVFVFYGLNGYLLGREYFELAALRRLLDPDSRAMRRRHRLGVLISGVVITVLLTIPVINCVLPVVAVAFMVHEFERLRRRDRLT
jgi:CysZ protein